MALQIWLLNPYKLHYSWTELCLQVDALIKPVVNIYDSNSKNKVKFGSVSVSNRYTIPPITARDLAIYVVPAPNFGFVGTDFGESGHRVDAGGLTSAPVGGQCCSEAYVGDAEIVGTAGEFIQVDAMDKNPQGVYVKNKASPMQLAKVIYHELMHYVTPKWSAEKLHGYPGVSLGKEKTEEYARQSEADKKILADHLTSHGLRFWTGAWEVIRGR
ncbi:MAG: hypothetical protein JNJ76_10090 [Candidatus Competibacter sp.]|nr:hypothetical protein [Candidatus Competibacter sp.]